MATAKEILTKASRVSGSSSASTHLKNVGLTFTFHSNINIKEERISANVIDTLEANILEQRLEANMIDNNSANLQENILSGDMR